MSINLAPVSKDTQRLLEKRYALQKRLREFKKHANSKIEEPQKLARELNGVDAIVQFALKQRNIRRTRKLSERRERADELISALREQKPKSDAAKTSSVRAEPGKTPFTVSDLVV